MPGIFIWYLVFVPANSMWWHKLLKRGYEHCFAFGFSPGNGEDEGRWIVFDPCFDRLAVRLASEAEIEGWMIGASQGTCTILKAPLVEGMLLRPRWIVTCAGALAALVGMRETPLTPWGLAKRLCRLGAQEFRLPPSPAAVDAAAADLHVACDVEAA
jgi:hypothetical protein